MPGVGWWDLLVLRVRLQLLAAVSSINTQSCV
jgi:hypothetical protein